MRIFCLQFGVNASLIDNVFMFSWFFFFFHRTIMTLIELYVAEDVWLLTAEDLFTGLNGKICSIFHLLFPIFLVLGLLVYFSALEVSKAIL